MFSYVSLGITDFDRAVAFYDVVMAPLGHARFGHHPPTRTCSWGLPDPGPHIWICPPFDGQPMHPGNGVMTSLLAATRAQVDAVYAAALAHGGRCEGPPGLRPHYGPTFYAGYFRDPDGNKLNAVCYAAQ
jgi:catechol 2,3-dioxygenase-like lactoylglutathione lyase family enzyme